MNLLIAPITVEHVASFRMALDQVAREKKYLAMIEAPALEQITSFVSDNIKKGIAQFVALDNGQVVGWADIVPAWVHGVAHRGSVGMGVLAAYRSRGIGRHLLEACIAKSWQNGLIRIEL